MQMIKLLNLCLQLKVVKRLLFGTYQTGIKLGNSCLMDLSCYIVPGHYYWVGFNAASAFMCKMSGLKFIFSGVMRKTGGRMQADQ